MSAKVFEEGGDVRLGGGEKDAVAAFKEFGEGFEVAGVGFAGEWAEAFFYAQVNAVLGQQSEIADGIHSPDYGLAVDGTG